MNNAPTHDVFLDGVQLHPDLIVEVDVDKGTVVVLLPIAKRTVGSGSEYVPIVESSVQTSPGVWSSKMRTVTLTGRVELR